MNKKNGGLRDAVQRHLTTEAIARKYNLKLPEKENGVCKCVLHDHNDSTPSFSISHETGLWNCFGCGKRGDMLTLVAEMENLDMIDDFPEVLSVAADIAGVSRDEISTQKDDSFFKKEWENTKKGDMSGQRSQYISKKKIDILGLGLDIRPTEDGKDFVVPIRNGNGKIIGGQRGLTKRAVAGSKAIGFFFEDIDRMKTVYVVEGLSDYLTMIACGIRNTVGMFSVNSSTPELKALLGEAVDIKICLDYDHYDKQGNVKKGWAGFKKTQEVLKNIPHAKAYFASYTDSKDISDVYVLFGAEGVKDIFNRPGKNYADLENDADIHIAPSLSPRIIGEFLAKNSLVATNKKESWEFLDGVWQQIPDEKIESLICNEFINRGKANIKFKEITEAKNFLRINTAQRIAKIKSAVFQEDFSNKSIYFSDGKYDLDKDVFMPYSPTDYVFAKLSSKFPSATNDPKLFIKFLHEIFAGKKNEEAYIEHIREWIGYCLYPQFPIHAFLYVYGDGGNGKGVLFDIIGGIIGTENTLNYNISFFEQQKERAIIQLFGKYVNLGTEEARGTNIGSPVLKSLTGGDAVSGRRLYKESFTFRPFSKMLFSSNSAPSAAEMASNVSRRLNLIHLENIFDDGKTTTPTRNLDQIILQNEKEEIIWWALGGLKNLLARGGFDKPEEIKANEAKLLLDTDPIASFCKKEKAFPRDGGQPIKLVNFYNEFKTYSIEDLCQSPKWIVGLKTFAERIQKHGYAIISIGGENYVTDKGMI